MSEFETAFNIPKHVPTRGGGNFFLPPNITTDFSRFLHQDTPGFVYTAKLIRDWEQKDEGEDVNPFIRCAMYPINWKSNFAAADEGVNFRTDFTHSVKKGDMIVREDGEIYLLNWAVHMDINNQPSQAKRCNHLLTIFREEDEIVDEYGYLISEREKYAYIDNMPVCAYKYQGRPDYAPSYNTPGINPDSLTIIDIQWNNKTKGIKINDEFLWGTITYRVVNIDMSGVNIGNDGGMLQLQARHVAGGIQDE